MLIPMRGKAIVGTKFKDTKRTVDVLAVDKEGILAVVTGHPDKPEETGDEGRLNFFPYTDGVTLICLYTAEDTEYFTRSDDYNS